MEIDMNELSRLIAQAVREALSGVSLNIDKAQFGYLAASAINENRAGEGKLDLEL